jgi:hypothetical protein
MSNRIKKCRICSSENFELILDLGNQCLTGVFPAGEANDPEIEPLELLKCSDCGLVQLAHNFNPKSMYGENYGYRSGLNQSMVAHLSKKASELAEIANIVSGDVVIDIGSNDGTFLSNFVEKEVKLIGVDPTADKFRSFYHPSIQIIADFFPTSEIQGSQTKAKLISSIAMFYDLPDPVDFAKAIRNNLHADGIWHFEQSYLPEMLKTVSYDTICHEHLEYYTLEVIEKILLESGMKAIDAKLNSTNGGSIAVTASHLDSKYAESSNLINLRILEAKMNLQDINSYQNFVTSTLKHREDLIEVLQKLKTDGKKVYGLGASTKGNVLLQYCQITTYLVGKIGEVNVEKFGKITPGSHIPIVSEAEMRSDSPDVLLVLPWHFKESIILRESEFLAGGGVLLFPLPKLTFVTRDGETSEY